MISNKWLDGFLVGLPMLILGACADEMPEIGSAESQLVSSTATLENCIKTLGSTIVPLENVRDLVPAQFSIAGEETGTAQLVFGVYSCEAVTVGNKVAPSVISQVGVALNSPDGTGVVNSYGLGMNTSNQYLAQFARTVGVPALVNKAQTYSESINGFGLIDSVGHVGAPFESEFTVNATGPGVAFPFPNFVSNWWQETDLGISKLSFTAPVWDIGFCGGGVTVAAGSPVAEILGGTSAAFDALCLQPPFDLVYGVAEIVE